MERDRKTNQAMTMEEVIANLPTHILIEIFSRLPIKAVMTFRCVSKSLLKLVSEPYFVQLYSTRAPTELLLRSCDQNDDSSTTLYLAEPKFLNDSSVVVVDMKFSVVFDLQSFSVRPKNRSQLRLNNSCHGLVCYCGPNDDDRFAVICNPITGEFVTFPAPVIKCCNVSYGLGFSPKENRYKLLRLLTQVDVETEPVTTTRVCEIYTFGGSGSWKSVVNCPAEQLLFNPLFFAGVLHWISWASWDIVTFDFDTEQFGQLVTPPQVGSSRICSLVMSVLGDCFYTIVGVEDRIQIWAMKEYGVQSSWIVKFSIPKDDGHSWQSDVYEPVKYLQNREILMFYNNKDIVCYNSDTTSFKSIGEFYSGYEKVYIRPSFVSLKMRLGDDVKVHNGKSWSAHQSCTKVATAPRWCASSAAPMEENVRLVLGG